jgi:hypothetical protein
MKLKITTDNEWEGKYQLIENQFKEDGLDIICLGDLIPTGSRKEVGGKSYFKTKVKELCREDPSIKQLGLYQQLQMVHDLNPAVFMDNYKEAPDYIKRASEFLKNSALPVMAAITGNREFDYQELLDFIADIQKTKRTAYLDEIKNSGRFNLITEPEVRNYDSTSALFLPHKPEGYAVGLDEVLSKLDESKGERVLIIAHENPCPEKFNNDRKAAMQGTLDSYIAGAKKINPDTTLLCGHLDISAEPAEYNGIKVQPVSGTETLILDMMDGRYTKSRLV